MEISEQSKKSMQEVMDHMKKSREKAYKGHEEFKQKMMDRGRYNDVKIVGSLDELKESIKEQLNKVIDDCETEYLVLINYDYIVGQIIKRNGYIDDDVLKVLMDLNHEQRWSDNGNTN